MIIKPIIENIEKIGTPEQRAKWVKALRSGKYKQHRQGMYNGAVQNSACCLMVANCEVDGYEWPGVGFKIDAFAWKALSFHIARDPHRSRSLVGLNDNLKLTFPQIADIIEGKEVEIDG